MEHKTSCTPIVGQAATLIVMDDKNGRRGFHAAAPVVMFQELVAQSASRCSLAIFSFHTSGASWWTFLPSESTATVTGMSSTVNS